MKAVAVATLILALGCTAMPPSTPAPVMQATAPATTLRNPEFRNVQLLSHEMSRDELIEVMRRFTQALGVRCNHCHVVTATVPEEEFDFPSDAKEEKRVARVMIQMTQQIRGPWMDRVEAAEEPHGEEATEAGPAAPKVHCWTCHRGKTEPEMPPPLPPRS
jgi:hypothetical protein